MEKIEMNCTNCGETINSSSIYCQYCGSKTQQNDEQLSKPAESKPISVEGNNQNSTIAIVFGALFFIAGLVALISRNEVITRLFSQQEILQEL